MQPVKAIREICRAHAVKCCIPALVSCGTARNPRYHRLLEANDQSSSSIAAQ
ncbi:hypothetical protein K438DRAFT_1847523 [Mycena galopus ATCC 62051]|nr:hypothetical protein K438DRAFT_1847523 [Mycena galopus ATCC 62051]